MRRTMGGGSLYDIGVYCINAARYLFQDNPLEVSAFSAKGTDKRFREVDEMTGALLRFPGDRLATLSAVSVRRMCPPMNSSERRVVSNSIRRSNTSAPSHNA